MEHRWNSRKKVNSIITVHLQQFGAIKAMVKNISRTGMLLDTRQFNLPRGSVVELAYTVLRKLERETVRIKALTIHAGDGLAGIMFIEHAGDIAALWDDCAEHPLPAPRHGGERHDVKPNNGMPGRAVAYASA
jgi:hypothetical protein